MPAKQWLLLSIAVLLSATASRAREVTEIREARENREADATRLVLELDLEGGTALPVALGHVDLPGYSARLALGVGVAPARWPLRLQLQTTYARSGTRFAGETHALLRTADSLLFGPRLTFPVYGGLSVFVEGLIGPSWVSADMEGPHPRPEEPAPQVLLGYSVGLGLQYALFRHLAFGLRAGYADEVDLGEDFGARLVLPGGGDPGRRVAVAAFLSLQL